MIQRAVFGGGCFWCTEAVFRRLKGIESVTPGYAGGEMSDPDYESVSTGRTGHAEVIELVFHPEEISYDQLLDVFFAVHDATQRNRQGADVGTQYRSIILTTSPEQSVAAQAKTEQLRQSGEEVTTEIDTLREFFTAEAYHLRYYDRNPTQAYCVLTVVPKLDKLREKFPELIKS